MYSTEQRGSVYTKDFKLYFRGEGKFISPMHDIPLFRNSDIEKRIVNMVVEIPRWTNAKMEICLKERLNPIRQDMKNDTLRFVPNCFPHKGYIWNYGALPQTWEDPGHVDPATECKGDGDPVDVCEIGQQIHEIGSVVTVKVLGVLALIDEGETDWKILAIDVSDPLADFLNDVNDIEKHMPGFLAATVEWFKIYKMPDGKPPNKFAFNGDVKNVEFALNVIAQTNDQWKKMMLQDNHSDLSRVCSVYNCGSKIEDAAPSDDIAEKSREIGKIPTNVHKWHYVTL